MVKKVRARGSMKQTPPDQLSSKHCREPIPIAHRKKGRHRGPLTVNEKIIIAYRVLVEQEYMSTVAREFRIGLSSISILITKVRKNHKFL